VHITEEELVAATVGFALASTVIVLVPEQEPLVPLMV